MMLSKEQRAAIRARCEGPTPGPWYAAATDDDSHMNMRYVTTEPGGFHHDDDQYGNRREGDKEIAITLHQCRPPVGLGDDVADENTLFIAHSRSDVPDLLDTVDELEQRLDRAKAAAADLSYFVLSDDRLNGPDRDHQLYETLFDLAKKINVPMNLATALEPEGGGNE